MLTKTKLAAVVFVAAMLFLYFTCHGQCGYGGFFGNTPAKSACQKRCLEKSYCPSYEGNE